MAYPYYPNNQYYMQDLQNMKDRIDRQMQQVQQLNQNQMQQQPQIPQVNQTFQLAPNPSSNTLWIKNTNGDIRTFELNEIIPQDPKDIEINNLKKELQRMREMINYGNEPDVNNTDFNEPNESKATTKLSSRTKSNAKQK